jgi:hypothetical protein
MHPESDHHRAWFQWPCAAFLALTLAAPAFAHDDDERREQAEKSPWNTSGMENPCVKNPVIKDERMSEQMVCDSPTGNCGVIRTETRTKQQRDKFEQRQRTRGEGFGRGDFTQVRYSLALDNTLVTRSKRNDTRTVTFNREMGHPQKTTLPFGSTSGSCSSTNIQACASPFVVTIKTETRNGVPVTPEPEADRECKNRDGSDRRHDQD